MPHTTAFARNQWYVAAYSHEVGRELLGRTILGEPLVFYRTEGEGTPVALADRCVHRRYPLSESGLDGDRIVCGYHGFTYDTTGACVYVPGQKRIPRTARRRLLPGGRAGRPDLGVDRRPGARRPGSHSAGPAPRLPRLDHRQRHGAASTRDYGLLVDNLLDLSHETYLHGGYIGTPRSPRRRSPPRSTRARASCG